MAGLAHDDCAPALDGRCGAAKVPFRNNIPVAPQGIKTPLRCRTSPLNFKQPKARTSRSLSWQRGWRIRGAWHFFQTGPCWSRNGPAGCGPYETVCWTRSQLPACPRCDAVGLAGLMDVALHPKFSENHFIYLTYTKPLNNDQGTVALARGVWTGTELKDVRDVFVGTGGSGGASRIAFGQDGTLYMTAGGGQGNGPQDPNSHAGKVLRLRDDGTVPSDNPFVGRQGYKPEVFSLGHRNSLGLAVHPGSGEVWGERERPQRR